MPGFSKSIMAKRGQGSTFEIVDQAGTGLSGVTITTSANANISFTYNTGSNLTYLLPPGQQVITATKAGYVTSKTAVDISGVVQMSITMASAAAIQSTHTISNANSNTITVTNTARAENNATVEFPAGAIVDSAGNPVSNASVQLTNVSVSDTGSLDIFPGSFVGDDNGTLEPIESFGFLNVNLTNPATGAALSLDPIIGATVRLPVDPDPVGTDTIGTYRLNESTGVWDLEGTAYRVPGTNIFEFPVTSFSWWNLDRFWATFLPFECQIYEGDDDSSNNDDSTVFSQPIPPGESPKSGVKVTVERPSDTPISRSTGYSDAQGFCQIPFVPGGFLFIRGRKGNKYYTPTFVTVDGGTIKAVLRPNGTVPTWPAAATLTANTFVAYVGGVMTFYLSVQGVDFTPKAYTITGVTSADIGGAALTGTIALTENVGAGQDNTASGTLQLTAGNVGQTSKTFTLTLNDMIGGSVISRSVTIMGPQNDAQRSTLGLSLDTTGTGMQYFPAASPLSVGPGHKVRVTLATRGIANMSLGYDIAGIISSDINGGSLNGNLQVVNGNPTANTSLSTLILTINPSFAGSKTAIFTVTFADSSFLSAVLYLSAGGGGS